MQPKKTALQLYRATLQKFCNLHDVISWRTENGIYNETKLRVGELENLRQ
jgi:hypothetical protein